jgi:16S rRNA (cytidine1402-2'-O)-methyltransferase
MSHLAGELILIPNTLDLDSSADTDLRDVLPLHVVETAARLAHWVAENAKTTRAFLKRVNAITPLAQPVQAISIIELPKPPKGARTLPPVDWHPLLAPALQGHDIGLISEAGLPAVADPGSGLVQAAHALQIVVRALSGPSSLMLALAASGLNGQSFAFVGYLPVEGGERAARIRELETTSRRANQTQLAIETPYRNEALLSALVSQLRPDTLLSVSCGLTLAQAWTRTDTVAQWKSTPAHMPADVPAVFSFLAR